MAPTECVAEPGLATRSRARFENHLEQLPFYLAYGSAVSIVFSIAVSQILLVLGIAALLISREKACFPPIKLPFVLFFVATVLADLFSGNPRAGMPQIRKFFVYAIVLLIFNTFRSVKQIRSLCLVWAGVGSLSALHGFAQALSTRGQAPKPKTDAYIYYLDGRITGFSSHWMTFGAQEMIVLLMLVSLLLFAPGSRWKIYGWLCAGVIWTALVLGMTRSIFLVGVPIGMLYLLWNYKRWIVATIPLLVAITFLISPFDIRERVVSAFRPHGELDSNSRRAIMRRTGWEMVKAHPWFGLGPEQIGPQFMKYVPSDVSRPLPRGWYGHLHNVYLQYAAERGVPALIFVMWMIGKILWDFVRALRKRTVVLEARFVLHGAVAVIGAVLAEGFFEHNLGDSEVLTMFLVVTACGYAVLHPSRHSTGALRPAY